MNDNDRIALSLIAQYGYCPRRAALILNERLWMENEFTAAGRVQHERAHDERIEKRGAEIRLYGYTVYSDALGLLGKCDCIIAQEDADGCVLPFSEKRYILFPVEYKHGIVRDEQEYKLQLCAQAMCLETMYDTSVKRGALFYTDAHRRLEVELTEALRDRVTQTVLRLHEMARSFLLPDAAFSAKCGRCSMNELCMPKAAKSASRYCERLMREAQNETT